MGRASCSCPSYAVIGFQRSTVIRTEGREGRSHMVSASECGSQAMNDATGKQFPSCCYNTQKAPQQAVFLCAVRTLCQYGGRCEHRQGKNCGMCRCVWGPHPKLRAILMAQQGEVKRFDPTRSLVSARTATGLSLRKGCLNKPPTGCQDGRHQRAA